MFPDRASLLFATIVFASACGTSPSATDAGASDIARSDATPSTDLRPTSGDAPIGTFSVQLVAPSMMAMGYTNVVGRIGDRTTPEQIVWEVASTDGDCRLLTPRVPFCSTPCGSGAACVENNTCRPFPTAQTAGTVRATGIRTSTGATTFDMNPVANTYQPPGEVTLPFPAFAEGDTLRLAAAGSATVPAFTLEARGITPLTLTSASIVVTTGQPVTLAWRASTQANQRVTVRLDISHHGGTRGVISCETADDGELSIGATLITRLVALGVAGFPSIVVRRSTVGSTGVPAGRVELVVASEIESYVTIPNLRSCTGDSDCDGGTCQADLTCR